VKVEFLRHAYPLLSPIESLDGIPLLSVADVAAMKFNAISNRGSKKDFFDVVELMEHHTLEEMLVFFSNKYRSSDPFTVIRSLAWFEDAEADPDPVSIRGCTWADVKSTVSAALVRLT
jgi:predicted nucleotidyltransferase component of viral defense system